MGVSVCWFSCVCVTNSGRPAALGCPLLASFYEVSFIIRTEASFYDHLHLLGAYHYRMIHVNIF
jgi:hypothetical protein